MRTTTITLSGSLLLAALLACPLAGCGSDGGDTGDDDSIEPLGGSLKVSGSVVDFETGAPVGGAPTVTTAGLLPAPQITVSGSEFVIDRVPEHSVFQILSGAPPTHRQTYNLATTVVTTDVSGVQAFALSETYLATLASGFGVTPSAAKGVLLARAVDAQGNGKAAVPAGVFTFGAGAALEGPFFLDENLQPAPALQATSASGWVVFFEADPGLTRLEAVAGSGYTLDMAASQVGAGSATLAEVKVTLGVDPTPQNVSFSLQVVPIFERRGCQGCHSGSGPGKDLGGLMLDGGNDKIFRELTVELSPNLRKRVDLMNPEASAVLTMPSPEDPPDAHPNITFASPNDPDYVLILAWIQQGAINN